MARDGFSTVFSVRLEAYEALTRAADPKTADSSALRAKADSLDKVTPDFQSTVAALAYSALAEFLRVAAMLVDWRAAILAAEPEASRFLTGAKERLRLWLTENGAKEQLGTLINAAQELANVTETSDVGLAMQRLAATPLPIGILERERYIRVPDSGLGGSSEPAEAPPELTVAFLQFSINGAPAAQTHTMTPGEVHDLDLEVRVSRWPDGAEELELKPVTIEQPGSYELPTFSLPRPSGKPPFILRSRGRALIKKAQNLQAKPFEFRYAAQFLPQGAEQPVAVVGQRDLRIEALDLKAHSITGYPNLDRKVVEVRDLLRSRPLATTEELSATITLLAALANLAGRTLSDNAIAEIWDEARFQKELRADLRRNPLVGAALQEHPRAGGGVTDLVFNGIPLELKSEGKSRLTLGDCDAYVDQAVSYAVALGKRLAVLCVLDCSLKKEPPFPAEDGISLAQRQTPGGGVVTVVIVLIQANLAMPSTHSRKTPRKRVSRGGK